MDHPGQHVQATSAAAISHQRAMQAGRSDSMGKVPGRQEGVGRPG